MIVVTDLRPLKQTVHLPQYRSRSVNSMEKELLTARCAYNFVREVMCVAVRGWRRPFRLTWLSVHVREVMCHLGDAERDLVDIAFGVVLVDVHRDPAVEGGLGHRAVALAVVALG